MTLIDSSYIGSCAQCGAALMPENQVTHSEWHAKQRDTLRLLLVKIEGLEVRLAEAQEAVTVVERMVVSEVEAREEQRQALARLSGAVSFLNHHNGLTGGVLP